MSEAANNLIANIFERRVPQFLAIYAGASWARRGVRGLHGGGVPALPSLAFEPTRAAREKLGE